MEEKPLALRWDERLMVIGSIMEVICCLYEGTKRAGNRVTGAHTRTHSCSNSFALITDLLPTAEKIKTLYQI